MVGAWCRPQPKPDRIPGSAQWLRAAAVFLMWLSVRRGTPAGRCRKTIHGVRALTSGRLSRQRPCIGWRSWNRGCPAGSCFRTWSGPARRRRWYPRRSGELMWWSRNDRSSSHWRLHDRASIFVPEVGCTRSCSRPLPRFGVADHAPKLVPMEPSSGPAIKK